MFYVLHIIKIIYIFDKIIIMRHLYDDIEDIKWILVELYNSVEFIKEKLNGNILFYKLESTYSDSDLNVAKLRLNDLEYEILSI